jgi:hypothetical protein
MTGGKTYVFSHRLRLGPSPIAQFLCKDIGLICRLCMGQPTPRSLRALPVPSPKANGLMQTGKATDGDLR